MLASELKAQLVGPEEITNILAPRALGAVLDDNAIEGLNGGLICGAATHRLGKERYGVDLRQLGFLYGPDYVVNAGGTISVAAGYLGQPGTVVETCAQGVARRLLSVIGEAKARGEATNEGADRQFKTKIALKRSEAA